MAVQPACSWQVAAPAAAAGGPFWQLLSTWLQVVSTSMLLAPARLILPLAGSHEALLHQAGLPAFCLDLRNAPKALAATLECSRLQRSVGVIYCNTDADQARHMLLHAGPIADHTCKRGPFGTWSGVAPGLSAAWRMQLIASRVLVLPIAS